MSGITHKWNGTILTVTSDSGTSSADLKGEKGDTGIRGAQGRTGFTIGNDGLIDTSGLATENYVEEAISNADREYLNGYATENYVDTVVADFEANNGLTTTEKQLLINILRSAVYTQSVENNINELEAALTYSPASLHYKVTNNLTFVTNSNLTASAPQGYLYYATLIPVENYDFENVSITMGGNDITDICYSNGVINIEVVTGDIVITATAKTNRLYATLVYGGIKPYSPYITDDGNYNRVSYVGFDIIAKANTVYKLVGVEGIRYGVQTITTTGIEKCSNNEQLTENEDKIDSGWQYSGYTFTSNKNAGCFWVTASMPDNSTLTPEEAMPVYIMEV